MTLSHDCPIGSTILFLEVTPSRVFNESFTEVTVTAKSIAYCLSSRKVPFKAINFINEW